MRLWLALTLLIATLPLAARPIAPVADPTTPPATRVATLDFIATEAVALLGHAPVAVANPGDYRAWVGIAESMIADARDLGRRGEPDLEALAASAPDLIVGVAFRHQPLAPALRRIAPTVLYDWLPGPEADALTRLRRVVEDLGQRLGRRDRAAAVLERMDRDLAAARQTLADAGLSGAPVVLAQHVRGTNRFNLYAPRSLGGAIVAALGLRPAWSGETGAFGFATVGLEGLARLDEAHILLAAQPDDRAFRQLNESPVWRALPAVAAGRVHRLAPRTWFFGGPRTVARLGEAFAAALVGDG